MKLITKTCVAIFFVLALLGLSVSKYSYAAEKNNKKKESSSLKLNKSKKIVSPKKSKKSDSAPEATQVKEKASTKINPNLKKGNEELNFGEMYSYLNAGYPILSSLIASDIISKQTNPFTDKFDKTWKLLAQVSRSRDIDFVIEKLSNTLMDKELNLFPKEFGNDWNYYLANSYQTKNQLDRSEKYYKKINLGDKYYFPSRYQLAMQAVQENEIPRAESYLKAILTSDNLTESKKLEGDTIRELRNLSNLALARLAYQQKKFQESINYYRKIDRDSITFYDALFEQSWAFFMGGYPNHALGSLHSVESPFFKDMFNPEASLLRSITYYWMCRYDDARVALADFSERHGEAVEALSVFLDRQKLGTESSYQLFENLLTGVSPESIGIPKNILMSAAESSSMVFLRNQYASLLSELESFNQTGIQQNKKMSGKVKNLIATYQEELRSQIGAQFLEELKQTKLHYDQLYSQAEFLYLELLMSEKEKLLGRELHASSKISRVDLKQRVDSWAKKAQAWNQSDKDEYWWDEVGYYIYRVEPMCESK